MNDNKKDNPLKDIHTPQELKQRTADELPEVCRYLREEIIANAKSNREYVFFLHIFRKRKKEIKI